LQCGFRQAPEQAALDVCWLSFVDGEPLSLPMTKRASGFDDGMPLLLDAFIE
jgi:hypothetical protein